MNVYKIGNKWIAAKRADDAFGLYLEDVFIDEMKEGHGEDITIKIKKLTIPEIEAPDMNCCFDGCDMCEGKDESSLVSLKSFINYRKPHEFPCIIAREE